MNLTDFSTAAKTKAKLDFSLAVKSGGKLDWKTNLGINPLFSEGGIKLDKVQLQTALALALSDTANFDIGGHELFNLDYKVTTDKKDLNIAIKKTKLELKDFQFTDKSADKNQLKTPAFSMETDANITLADNKLDVVINKAKLDSKDLQFANQIPKPLSVFIPKLSHETDLKISQIKEELKVSSNKAQLNLANIEVAGLNQDKIEVKIPDIALAVGYQLGLLPVKDKKDKQLDVLVNKGTFDLHGLVLSEKGAPKPLIVVPAFGLTGVDVNLNKQEVNIASVDSKDATFEAWLDKDGVINYQTLLPPPAPEPVKPKNPIATARVVNYQEDTPTEDNNPPTTVNNAKKNWLIKVNNLALNNFGLRFEDKSLKKPVIIKANPINLKLSSFSTQPDTKLPFQLDLGINKTGSIQLHGDAVIAPLVAKIAVAIKNIDLETFQPYVDKFARLDILDGKFNAGGSLTLQQAPEKPLAIKFTGNTGIADLLTRDQIVNKDFVKWDNLTFKDLDIDVLANRFAAKLLLIEKPYAKVTIRKDKSVNFSDILIADKSEKNTKSKTAKPIKSTRRKTSSSDAPLFKLDKIKIVEGSSDFADLSLILPFAAQIKSLDGGANGISSEQKSTIHVDLKGNAYDLAPVDINGEISPYLGNFNVNLKFDGMPMPLVTPYMVQFAGYKIEKGKLTMGLQYQVEKGQLKAANNIVIDQLELGEKVENPNAVSLPLELAITLLKDSDGKIKLDVPLTGSLEDPKFDMGGIIFDALVNVLTKIVTSPFNAIASLVGSEENLSVIAFTPGKDSLEAKETKKLDDVAKALKEKTALNLEVKGAAFIEQDWPILREEALLDQLKKTKAAELSKEEGKRIRAEYVELSPDDYNDLLADAFIKQFPAEGEKNLFGQPKLKNSEEDFYKVAKLKLSKILKPEPERLKDLANDRAKTIAKYIVEKGGIPNERVFILDSAVDPKRDGKDIVSALSLKTN